MSKLLVHVMLRFGDGKVNRMDRYNSSLPGTIKSQLDCMQASTSMINKQSIEGVICTWNGPLDTFQHDAAMEMCTQCAERGMLFALLMDQWVAEIGTGTRTELVQAALANPTTQAMLNSSAYLPEKFVLDFGTGADFATLAAAFPTLKFLMEGQGYSWINIPPMATPMTSDARNAAAVANLKQQNANPAMMIPGLCREFKDCGVPTPIGVSLAAWTGTRDYSQSVWSPGGTNAQPARVLDNQGGAFFYDQVAVTPTTTPYVAIITWNDYDEGTDIESSCSIATGIQIGENANQYQQNFALTSAWAGKQSRSTGAIEYTPNEISPYFGNLAAIGMCLDPARLPQVVSWMTWYISRLNDPDTWGLTGSIWDYSVINGVETSLGTCDSVDSYAATFLSLAWALWQTGDPASQAYIKSIATKLDMIGGVLTSPKMQQPDGLTWAIPNYEIKYLMDNCEVYAGFSDITSLFTALGNPTKAAYYSAAAASSLMGILSMYVNGAWSVSKGDTGVLQAPDLAKFYPDAQVQLFPVLHGIVTPSSSEAVSAYAAFNKAWPGWTSLSFATLANPFPQCMLGVVAGIMGDTARLETYIASVAAKYVPGFQWPWYDAEAGWFLRCNALMFDAGGIA